MPSKKDGTSRSGEQAAGVSIVRDVPTAAASQGIQNEKEKKRRKSSKRVDENSTDITKSEQPRSQDATPSSQTRKKKPSTNGDASLTVEKKKGKESAHIGDAPQGIHLINEVDEHMEDLFKDSLANNTKYEKVLMTESEIDRRKILSLILMLIFFEADLPTDLYKQLLETEAVKRFVEKLTVNERRLLAALQSESSAEVPRTWSPNLLPKAERKQSRFGAGNATVL